jgi:hypothetical protein
MHRHHTRIDRMKRNLYRTIRRGDQNYEGLYIQTT